MATDLTIVEVVNRTTKDLNFMFDGTPGVVYAGYRVNDKGKVVPAGRDGQPRTTPLQRTAAEYARRQNVEPGSEDPISGEANFLIGVAQREEDGKIVAHPTWLMNAIDYVPPTQVKERLRRSKMDGDAQTAVEIPSVGFPQSRVGAGERNFNYQEGPGIVKD